MSKTVWRLKYRRNEGIWMKKYRIAMIASCMTINGISTVIKNYCENIDLKRFSITVIAGKPINELYRTEFEKLGIEVIELPERKENTVQYYVELVRTFRKKRIDVVHVHGNSATISLELLLAKIAGVKVRIAIFITVNANMKSKYVTVTPPKVNMYKRYGVQFTSWRMDIRQR